MSKDVWINGSGQTDGGLILVQVPLNTLALGIGRVCIRIEYSAWHDAQLFPSRRLDNELNFSTSWWNRVMAILQNTHTELKVYADGCMDRVEMVQSRQNAKFWN
jgi:hypothetical protein